MKDRRILRISSDRQGTGFFDDMRAYLEGVVAVADGSDGHRFGVRHGRRNRRFRIERADSSCGVHTDRRNSRLSPLARFAKK